MGAPRTKASAGCVTPEKDGCESVEVRLNWIWQRAAPTCPLSRSIQLKPVSAVVAAALVSPSIPRAVVAPAAFFSCSSVRPEGTEPANGMVAVEGPSCSSG